MIFLQNSFLSLPLCISPVHLKDGPIMVVRGLFFASTLEVIENLNYVRK